ncbi:NAD(P)H-quinone oxidoreductase [Rhizobium sp. PAMB 3174]
MLHPEYQTAVIIKGAGGPEVLVAERVPVQSPGPGEVLIRVSAAGVNRHDVHQRAAGKHSDGQAVPGLEVCGTIVAVGEGVGGVAKGERVMALVQGGGYGQYVVANAGLVMPAPVSLSDAEAAGIPEAVFTTWWNFFNLMALEKDQFALFHGGTSGVGHIALQAMSALGYNVLVTCGSDKKVSAALNFGARAAFRYDDPELADKVLAATGNKGISALLDVSAGAHLAQDLKMMAPDGMMAHLSGGGGADLGVPLREIMAKRIRITGSLLRPLPMARKIAVANMIRKDVWPLFGREVRPQIDGKFDFTKAADAHRMMENNSHIGKIILEVRHD